MLKAPQQGRIGILVGGGPAPGINSVISSVTIEAKNLGYEVIGFYDGFSHLSQEIRNFVKLQIEMVSRIQNRGGSILRTSRFNPTKDKKHLKNVVKTLIGLNVTHLVTIGGEDTAFSAICASNYAKENMGIDLHVVHVPKTIDNDLPLPEGIPTFGYNTARQLGAQLVTNLMEDAKTTKRWYLAVVMGRTAGHLALGIGKSAGATLTIIPEEFNKKISLSKIGEIVTGSIVKRIVNDRPYGVAVLAEGLIEKIQSKDLEFINGIERDAHGHLRLSEINFSDIVKQSVNKSIKDLNLSVRLVDKEIGYELRCAPPIAFDIEYTRNLGYAAVDFLIKGGSSALISIQHEQIVPIPFDKMWDSKAKKMGVRLVNTKSLQYQIAKKYMIRLQKDDLENSMMLEQLAAACGLLPEEFKKKFPHLN